MNIRSTVLLALAALLLWLAGCHYAAKNVYTSKSFKTVARHHKTIAILPFDVRVGLRPNEMRNLTPERHYDLELKHGRAVQSALQVYFLHTVNAKKEVIAVQDVRTTNALLEEKDIQPEELTQFTPTELAQLLGVDAVLMGSLTTEKPLSTGAALAIAAYTFFFTPDITDGGPTNAGNTTMKIYDGATGDLLWSYDKMLARGLGSDTQTIVRAITRKASKKIPYGKLKA
ncbi:hypothetical protein [Rufibacter ruber]|uniref:hypothetical protein n=1 Tax=Rufibacter ruber TaxID=1783499 RepID=UPI0009EDC51A|nr:hypothetical protein [Rufibacter ruber]